MMSTKPNAIASRSRKLWISSLELRSSTPVLMISSDIVGIGHRPLRQLEQKTQQRPKGSGNEAADKIAEAGKIGAADLANYEHDQVIYEQQRYHVQNLVYHREHQHAAVQYDAGEGEHRVGERMLAEEGTV